MCVGARRHRAGERVHVDPRREDKGNKKVIERKAARKQRE